MMDKTDIHNTDNDLRNLMGAWQAPSPSPDMEARIIAAAQRQPAAAYAPARLHGRYLWAVAASLVIAVAVGYGLVQQPASPSHPTKVAVVTPEPVANPMEVEEVMSHDMEFYTSIMLEDSFYVEDMGMEL